jgi:uncharacterized protein (TIGR02466 family)
MDHVVMPLFPIPIYISTIELSDTFKEEIKNLDFKRIDADNGDLSIDTRLLENPIFDQIKQEILKHVELYARESLKVADHITFKIKNSWAMKHKKNDYSQPHVHTNSILSGILYIEVDKDSGNLVFQKDLNYTNLFPPAIDISVKERNIFNSKRWTFTPTVGQLFMFPSHLTHSVTTCLSDNIRYCLAFNLFPEGTLGLEHGEALAILDLT